MTQQYNIEEAALPAPQQKLVKKYTLGKYTPTCSGYWLLSNGKSVAVGFGAHSSAAMKAGTSLFAVLNSGAARIDVIHNLEVGVAKVKKLTDKQKNWILHAISREPNINKVYVDTYGGRDEVLRFKTERQLSVLLFGKSSMQESSIDFPKDGLDPHIWEKADGEYKLRQDVKKHILSVLNRYPGEDLIHLGKIHIVGSICSNQYADNADIDVHINPENPSKFDEDNVKRLKKWFDTNRDKINGWIDRHPIEVYLQLNPKQDMLSDGVYDVATDTWEKGPKIVDASTNPYEDYKDLADEIRQQVKKADELLGELKRDVIDYDIIAQALERMSADDRAGLLKTLEQKLEEIEDGIEQLHVERGGWTKFRKDASKPESLEQAKKDVALAKNWEDKNAIFKFLARYRYMRVIGNLKELLVDDQLDPEEIEKVKTIVGVHDDE